VAWLAILRVVNPASAYVQRVQRVLNPGPVQQRRRRRDDGPLLLPAESSPHSQTASSRQPPAAVQERYQTLRAELEPIRSALEEPVRALLKSGASGFRAKSGLIDLKLVRFWNGTGILQGRLLGTDGWSRGPVFSLVDRRSLRQDPPTDLERMLFSTMLNLEV
jgi:hypothetical protein